MNSKTYTRTLTIAGSDSGGGAGIQADLKTFSALGCYGVSVITALTAQNTQKVAGIHEIDSSFVAQQMDAVIGDIGVDAVKIGMLFSADIIRVVAGRLKDHKVNFIVLDPVMVAKSGDKLLQDNASRTMVEELFPVATLITPNIAETAELTDLDIKSKTDLPNAAHTLFEMGAANILIKGGHLDEETATDFLFCRTNGSYNSYQYSGERIQTKNTHGTGCTYSSAITAFLARGCNLNSSVRFAKQFMNGAIKDGAGYKLGSGHGPVHHFFDIWNR